MEFSTPSQSAFRKFLNVRWEASVNSMSHSMLRVIGVWSDPSAWCASHSIFKAMLELAILMSGELLQGFVTLGCAFSFRTAWSALLISVASLMPLASGVELKYHNGLWALKYLTIIQSSWVNRWLNNWCSWKLANVYVDDRYAVLTISILIACRSM